MILVNDKQVEFTKFPDGTTSFRFSPHLPPRMFAQPMESPIFSITWKYKSIGTLGGGNHFIEANKDDDGHIYMALLFIASFFIKKKK